MNEVDIIYRELNPPCPPLRKGGYKGSRCCLQMLNSSYSPCEREDLLLSCKGEMNIKEKDVIFKGLMLLAPIPEGVRDGFAQGG